MKKSIKDYQWYERETNKKVSIKQIVIKARKAMNEGRIKSYGNVDKSLKAYIDNNYYAVKLGENKNNGEIKSN